MVRPEEIHLQQADALERVHVVLRGDFILVRLVERDDFGERLRRNHHAGGVRRGVARQPFQAQRDFDQFLHALVLLAQRVELRRLLQRVFERDIQLVGNQLRDPVHVAVGHIERAAGIFQRRFRGHRSEGDDLRHALLAVCLGARIRSLRRGAACRNRYRYRAWKCARD